MTVGQRLRAKKDAIIAAWERRTRERLPPAQQERPPALIDGLPDLFDCIVGVIESTAPAEVLGRYEDELAREHGRTRAHQAAWSLAEVITEYQLFRQVLFAALDDDGVEVGRLEREAILDSIHAAIRNAVREFEQLRSADREERLAAAEQRFAGFVEAVKDYAIFTVDPGGFITHWNVGAERMKQYTPEEAIGHHFSMLYPEEGRRRDEPMGHLRAAAIEGRFRGEGVRIRKNGEHFLADVSITPLYENGRVIGYTKVVQDLTERNLIVQERDLSRSESDRLRVQAEYRERFVQTLTHDLRSPLSAAKAAAGLIARAPEDQPKVRNWAHRISDAVDRCDAMIADLLDAARLHAGETIPVRIEHCDLARIVADASDELSTRHGNRFRVEVEGSTQGWWCPYGMRRVIDNLLSNALKYGERGGLVTTHIRHVSDRVLVMVHNFGTIIPAEEQAKLFQPFHRSADAQSSGQAGWGIGLTLVNGIVTAHGGIVKVESYPKEGTTFTVDLPVDSRGKSDEPGPVPG